MCPHVYLFRIIFLGFALLLTLTGNSVPLGICVTDGSVSLAGISACDATAVCENVRAHASASDCDHCFGETEKAPHEQRNIELGGTLRAAGERPVLPEVLPSVLAAFFENVIPEILFESAFVPVFVPPENRRRSLFPPRIAGTLPLLA